MSRGILLGGGTVAVGLMVALILRDAASPPPARRVVEIENMAFHPADVRVHKGDTLVWVNHDIVPHTVTAADSSWTSPPLAQGERWTHVVDETGSVAYSCRFHPPMTGLVTVVGDR